jgi:hypothetical protein
MLLRQDIEAKPSKKEVPTMTEFMQITELGIEYNAHVYVRKEFVTVDTSAYFYAKRNIYGDQSILRGEKQKFYKHDHDSVTNENNKPNHYYEKR